MDIQAVGIDLGGTWIRLRAVDRQGHVLRSYTEHAPSLKDLPHHLRRLWRRWNWRVGHLKLASRGIWTPHERQRLTKSLRGLARHVTVMSDVEAAWLGAFHQNGAGVLIIAGTGSIAFGKRLRTSARAGGLGPYLGDEGSGFWIGKEWLKRQGQETAGLNRTLEFLHHLHAPVREIAGLAPTVLTQAKRGNSTARAIIKEAQGHLAQTVLEAARLLCWRGPLDVSWGGSLLDNEGFRRGFSKALRQKAHKQLMPVRFVTPSRDPIGALLDGHH